MTLSHLPPADCLKIASLLAKYWNSRGMPQYDKQWALSYLKEGHAKERVGDEFFQYTEDKNLIGIVSLIVDVSGVAEIRDEVVFSDYKEDPYRERMIGNIIEYARRLKLRKLFSLATDEWVETYRSLGFEKEGALRDHFVEGENLTIMSKFL